MKILIYILDVSIVSMGILFHMFVRALRPAVCLILSV